MPQFLVMRITVLIYEPFFYISTYIAAAREQVN